MTKLFFHTSVRINSPEFHCHKPLSTVPAIQSIRAPQFPAYCFSNCDRSSSGTWRSGSRWRWSTATPTSSSACPSTPTAACWPPAARTRRCGSSSRAREPSCRSEGAKTHRFWVKSIANFWKSVPSLLSLHINTPFKLCDAKPGRKHWWPLWRSIINFTF